MRTPIIAGNWKMNNGSAETRELIGQLIRRFSCRSKVSIAIFPSFPYLYESSRLLEGKVIRLGAQDLHWETQGAFTGEVSGMMLRDVGCDYVIVGHSERRHIFKESNEQVLLKLKAALRAGLHPILCVGETLEEREDGSMEQVVRAQLKGLSEFTLEEITNLVLAYEPVWAIGTGKTASPEEAQNMHAFIRRWIQKHFGNYLSDKMIILYGGSVKPENIKELMARPDIDGALVGGASLDAGSFSAIIQGACETVKEN